MKNLLATLSTLLLLAILPGGAQGAPVKLVVGPALARVKLLTPGVRRYVRYTVSPAGARAVIDVWTRTLSVETVEGERRIHFVQRWDEAADKAVLIQDSWVKAASLEPITHIRHLERGGVTSIGGYEFATGRVVGMASLPDNGRKDFVQDLPEPAFNFEYDMEFLQALELARGRVFDIPFYDPGLDKPGRYLFNVAGGERVRGPDGHAIDCWLITADYNTGKVVSRFWFAKSNQVLIREQQDNADGSRLIKALLPAEPGD
jgi:hypothetical protein